MANKTASDDMGYVWYDTRKKSKNVELKKKFIDKQLDKFHMPSPLVESFVKNIVRVFWLILLPALILGFIVSLIFEGTFVEMFVSFAVAITIIRIILFVRKRSIDSKYD